MLEGKNLLIRPFLSALLLVFGLSLGMTGEVGEVYATAGACSSHDGVSCVRGPDSDGSVICADGWSDSTVNYYETDECMDYLCPEQQVLYDALYAASDWSLGIANICEELGWTDYGYLDYCLAIRQQELDAQWADLWAQVNDVRYLCYDDFEAAVSDDAFTDVSSTDEYSWAINALYDSGVIGGYDDGTYRPDDTINRAEFVKILVGVGDTSALEDSSRDCFTDVSTSDWYSKYVCLAKDLGVIDGYADGSFGPGNTINVAEALKITFEALNFDVPDASGEWYQKYVDYAQTHSSLYLNAWASIDQQLTRGEMAELIYRAINS